MSGGSWRIEDAEPSPTPPGVVQGSWISLHYLRSTLRRRWRLVAATTTAGLMLALAMLFLLPASSTASATVLLAHDPAEDPMTAIATDTKLLKNREVADMVIKQLNLPLTPDQFLGTFTTSQPSTQMLVIDLKAATPAEAVRRLSALCQDFLDFRKAALSRQAEYVAQADQNRITVLNQQAKMFAGQYDTAVASGQQDLAQQLIGRRTTALSNIQTLQQNIQDTTLQAAALAQASNVVDQAAVVPTSHKKRLVLGVMSGLILGGGLGVGIVFAYALVSNRLRRREEIATALGHPVAFSAGPVHGRMPWGKGRRRRNLEILSRGLEQALPEDRQGREQLAVIGIGDLRASRQVLVHTGRALVERGEHVFLVDLTEEGVLGKVHDADLPVLRPEPESGRSTGPLSLVSSMTGQLPDGDPRSEQWDRSDVVLVLGEVELGLGTQHLARWADRSVVLVSAGKVTAEFLRSASRMLNSAGPKPEFAMVVGADRTDESLGVPRPEVRDEQQRRFRG